MSPARIPLDRGGRLPPAARLRKSSHYQHIQSRGIRVHTPALTIVALARGDEGPARMGCAVSRKVGGAVLRNRLRRLFKECFRRSRARFGSVDLVIIAKPEARALANGGLRAVSEALLPALERAERKAQHELQ